MRKTRALGAGDWVSGTFSVRDVAVGDVGDILNLLRQTAPGIKECPVTPEI